ncbi:NfeD family protein [Sanguibacter sp. 4.1]|jgi:membrane protein implicated in regulation of membrane protease activity|uniref:NfeD family protein n=1 Tax=Sanguibacter biliveldensis TaxID=3030830 RepID=A0AAF0Z0Y9_9MICO|nr:MULTISPECIES: NfeD family protein [unclassified Sanguibacter]KQT98566.1 hypothetical protein ASG53_13180 [Sanguibacter sp. Leaf3]WPF80888.1 NfeD family protein [Sanguibacter sp. 4.1]
MDWYWWIGAALLLVVVEMVSLDLVLIMFAGGAIAAGIASALGLGLVGQIVVFGVVSTLLLLALRPWLLKYLRQRTPLVETGVAALAGRTGTVVSEVSDESGRIKLLGEVWTARSLGDVTFPVGADVRVVKIDGATAVVDAVEAPYSSPGAPPVL